MFGELEEFYEKNINMDINYCGFYFWDSMHYVFLMVISFVVGLVGLWKIVFAPLKEKWY